MVERDINIVRHVETYGFITIKQAQKIFFNKPSYGYDLARKRLRILEEKGHLSSVMNKFTKGEKIFYLDEKFAYPKEHTMLIMDCYSEIAKIGGEVLVFNREKRWLDGKRRSDAYCIFKIDEFLYEIFFELRLGNNHGFGIEYVINDMNKKYTQIIESGEPQAIVNGLYNSKEDIQTNRRIVIADDVRHTVDWQIDNEITIQVSTTFECFSKILL